MLKGLKDKMFNISSSAKRIVLISGVSALALVVMVSAFFISRKEIVIIDENNSKKEVVTFKRYVEGVLESEGIALFEGDKLSVGMNDKLRDNMEIEIYRAFPVTVVQKGEKTLCKTTKHTVGEALIELGLNAKETDKMSPGFHDKISAFDEITFVKIEEKIVDVTEEIPYESKETVNKSLASGQKKLIQSGKLGEKEVSYRVSYEDGVEISREKINEKIITEPVAQIKEVGPSKKIDYYQIASAGSIQTSRSGNLSYSRVITANATAYDASSCGKAPSHPAYGITATGARAGKGIVAVDPSVIPLGTKLYIETVDGSYVYGVCIAADTGGAIKGNRIDLCYNTRAEAIQFGRKPVKVYILN